MLLPIQTSNRYKALLVVVILIGTILYLFRLTTNPAGFFVDESSIAYNAFTISQSAHDEFGNSWPLFFPAFGDYKNPVHIYLLAIVFKLTGPSILTARLLSALAGIATSILLGRLAGRISSRREIALLITATAFLTPWLFEISRVVLEVALYPLALTLFLSCVWSASKKPIWAWREILGLAFTLTLLTYTYSIGRLLAPLLAALLVCFYSRPRLSGLVKVWALYALTLLPMFLYQMKHREALTARFNLITYMKPGTSFLPNAWQFLKHFAGNLDPRRLLLNGDPNIFQVVHVYGKPAMLAASVAIAFLGIVLIILRRGDAWWRFIVCALVASTIPASLTVDYFHMLRLVAMPVLLLLLMVPALGWLSEDGKVRHITTAAMMSLILIQGAVFQFQYHAAANSPWRRHLFDADYPEKIFTTAVATGSQKIYLADAMPTPYIQAYWYATIKKVPLSRFVRLPPEQLPPLGAVVISTEESCSQSHVLAQVEPYTVYISDVRARARSPLPDDAFHASLNVADVERTFGVGSLVEMQVRVRNDSNTTWPGCERGASAFQIYLGSHWLDTSGNWAKEEGRTALPHDLGPGQETTLKFAVIAPLTPGEYVLELDLLQEAVTWFGIKGSPTTKVRITVR